MSRANDLHKIFEGIDDGKKKIVTNLIDEAVFLETQMQELKKFPFIKTRVFEGVTQTKQTAAGKQYRDYLQTYTNIIDKLCRIYSNEETGNDDSPLREYFKKIQAATK